MKLMMYPSLTVQGQITDFLILIIRKQKEEMLIWTNNFRDFSHVSICSIDFVFVSIWDIVVRKCDRK